MKYCYKCKKEKTTNEFGKNRRKKDGLQPLCLECVKDYRRNNKEKFKAYDRKKYLLNTGKIKDRTHKHRNERRDEYLAKSRAYSKRKSKELKQTIVNEYGSKCVCCGEKHVEFLTIDHIDGSGGKHRKEVGSGIKFYRWLVKQNFPKDNYRLLCFNCNCSIGHSGYCPHDNL